MATTTVKPETLVGKRIRRREDPRLITGRATYVDDVKQVGTVYAAFVRSPYGHAKLLKVDVSAAKAHPAVLAAYTGDDLHHAQGLTDAQRTIQPGDTLYADFIASAGDDDARAFFRESQGGGASNTCQRASD